MDLPEEPSPGALAALAAAERMMDQVKPAIWYDSWSNDGRDNNLDGIIDDRGEQGSNGADGAHYGRTYSAKVAPFAFKSIDSVPAALLRTIDVSYKVCIDIPIEAYKAARVPISTSRWIPTFFRQLKAKSGWRVWDAGKQPATLMDGDIVAASNSQHQHAGIVQTGLAIDSVINLPGPTAARKYHVFSPSGVNDIVSVPRILFEKVLRIDLVARWIGG
jgi:hypothetical protein